MRKILSFVCAAIAVIATTCTTAEADAGGCGNCRQQVRVSSYYQDVAVAQPIVVYTPPVQQVVQYTEQVALPQTQYFVQQQRVRQAVSVNQGYGYGAEAVVLQNKHGRVRQQVNVDVGANVRTRVRTVNRPLRRNVSVSSVRSH